ncbi:MAG: restriction endonuclease subunit S [Flavobacterium sp.]|uniref:restriction endonuclease subunit S n=1 Tax=Flavobacterium sp. TaxID=239 RepID=UPI003BA42EFC
MSETILPKDWKWFRLKDICEVVTGTTPSKSDLSNYGNEIPFFKPPHLWDGLISETEEMLSSKGATKARVVPPNTVLVTCIGNLGRTGFVKKEAAFNQQINAILENDKIDGKYIFYQAQSPFFKNQLEKLATGTTVSIVNKGNFETINIPVAPLKTQQAIVSKIEELFSELDKGIEDLKTAQQQLKTYRQSVLKWAFEGKLTNENVKDGELPKGWEWSNVKDISTLLGDGLHGTPKYDINGEYYFINGNNLNDGKIEIKENTKTVSKEEFEKYKKQLNDKTIFVSINGSLGYTAFYNNEPVILGKSACYFNVKEGINKHYIRYIFTSQRFTNYSTTVATGSTIKNVSLKSMREFEIPLPPTLEEQHRIVQEIESRLSVADKMEESIAQSLQQAETLRQSILKKAFSGELV